jgi:uncharacterized protein
MAAQFFAAVDADIAGVRPQAAGAAEAAGRPGAAREVEGVAAGPRPTSVGTSTPHGGRRDFGWGVLTGGAVALAGVIVGWAIGGRS